MRPVASDPLLSLAGVLVPMLALGALPGYLASGNPSHVEYDDRRYRLEIVRIPENG